MRCHECGGFLVDGACPNDHDEVGIDPSVHTVPEPRVTPPTPPTFARPDQPWKPHRFGWYGYRHEVGLGEWAVEYTSEAQVLRLGAGTATVCVFGPVVFTTEVPFNDLTDLPGDDDGD